MFFKSHALKSRANGRLVSRPTHKCDMARPIQKHPAKRPAIIPRSSQDAGSTLILLLLGYFLGRWPRLLHPVASGRGPASTMCDIHHPQIFTLRRQSDGVVIVAWALPASHLMHELTPIHADSHPRAQTHTHTHAHTDSHTYMPPRKHTSTPGFFLG